MQNKVQKLILKKEEGGAIKSILSNGQPATANIMSISVTGIIW